MGTTEDHPWLTLAEVPAAALTPAQRALLDELRGGGGRVPFDADLADRLRHDLEDGVGPLAERLERPLSVSKAHLGHVHSCEAYHRAEMAAEFSWSVRTARGTVAHKAVELSVHMRGDPTPLDLVDTALDRLADDADDTKGVAPFLRDLGEGARAELRSEVNDYVAKFAEQWPPLQKSWLPCTESAVRVELCGGRIVLRGKVDLTLGQPEGTRPGKVLIDLKSGEHRAAHVDDLRYYALLETLRGGVPPFRLAGYALDSGTLRCEDVTVGVLEATVRRTIDGLTKLIELHLGARLPRVTPNPACGWCRLRDECDGARSWEHQRDELAAPFGP